MVKRLGLRLESISRTHGGHFKTILSDGQVTRMIMFPSSASDHRWERNKCSEIKRIFKTEYEKNQS